MQLITLSDPADEYHGYDHDAQKDVDLVGDELAEVSDQTAERLAADHDGRFVIVDADAAQQQIERRSRRARKPAPPASDATENTGLAIAADAAPADDAGDAPADDDDQAA